MWCTHQSRFVEVLHSVAAATNGTLAIGLAEVHNSSIYCHSISHLTDYPRANIIWSQTALISCHSNSQYY